MHHYNKINLIYLINSIKRNSKLETSKEKIQNFLNDSLNESKSKNSNSNNKKMNKNKYQELYDQINLIDSMNTIKKNKPLIPYSQYKNYSIKKSTIKKIEIKTQKLFKKYDNLFSDLENPKKSEWINNNLFKSNNLFNYNKQKDFFDIGDNNLGKINFDNTEKKFDSYYKNELNFFGQRLNKGNFSISKTPNNNRKNIDIDFTIKLNKNNALEKLNNW